MSIDQQKTGGVSPRFKLLLLAVRSLGEDIRKHWQNSISGGVTCFGARYMWNASKNF